MTVFPDVKGGRSAALFLCRRGLLAALLALLPACAAGPARGVIRFDHRALDANGLAGPSGGKVAVDYEFCVPDRPEIRAEVSGIDPSVRFHPGSRGRIGCGPGTVLCIGNTHQPGHRRVLERLARLPYVRRIERCFWE